MEEHLKSELSKAIDEFNKKRTPILALAYKTGGQEAVDNAKKEFQALRKAYFDILKYQLDKNNQSYNELIAATRSEAEHLTESIDKLNNINEIINKTATVVKLIGRIILILAI